MTVAEIIQDCETCSVVLLHQKYLSVIGLYTKNMCNFYEHSLFDLIICYHSFLS